MSEALYPGYSTGDHPWWRHFKNIVPANAFFHEFPIIWLLPEGKADHSGGFDDSIFEMINAVPPDVPRVFLSHMPTVHFEFEPTQHTRIMYLLREPHAQWRSMYTFTKRLRGVLNEHFRNTATSQDQFYNETVDPSESVWDFMEGMDTNTCTLKKLGVENERSTDVDVAMRVGVGVGGNGTVAFAFVLGGPPTRTQEHVFAARTLHRPFRPPPTNPPPPPATHHFNPGAPPRPAHVDVHVHVQQAGSPILLGSPTSAQSSRGARTLRIGGARLGIALPWAE